MSNFDLIDRLCARRVQDAITQYGILDLRNDKRSWIRELQAELLDAINYARWAIAKGELSEDVGQGIIWVLKNIFWCHILPIFPPEEK